MSIINTTYQELPSLLKANAKVMAMFTTSQSATCEQLSPVFELFATNQAYQGITFLRLSFESTAAAKRYIDPLAAPFFSIYSHGQLVQGESLSTEHQVRAVLHALYAHH